MKNNPKLLTVGSVWESKNYGSFEVIEYEGCRSITVRFLETGFEIKSRPDSVRSGAIKDRMAISVCGVGFMGDGCYGRNSKYYSVWASMLNRCYSAKFHDKYPTYNDCSVCSEWHNFQNFAGWCEENYPKNCDSSIHLDKDLKIIGNKVYSPDSCLFVPSLVNSFILIGGAFNGGRMIGSVFSDRLCKFKSQCSNPLTGEKEYIGIYANELDAHLAWRERKSELAYELAMIQDREEVKQALLNWKEALDNKLIHPY